MSEDYGKRVASAFMLPTMAAEIAGITHRVAILRKKYRKEKGRSEWALLDSKGEKVLRWFGLQKPSDEHVKKEEKRIQYFKHQGSSPVQGPPDDLYERFPSYVAGKAREAALNVFKHLTYGVLPDEATFSSSFEENVQSGTYNIQNDKSVGSGQFNESELYKLLQDLTKKYEDGDEEAGDTASSILYTLGIEWV